MMRLIGLVLAAALGLVALAEADAGEPHIEIREAIVACAREL